MGKKLVKSNLHIVSLSLGSSRRDKTVQATFAGTPVTIDRIGTNGDMTRLRHLLGEWDGRTDAIGLGGMDRYLYADGRRYEFRQTRQLVAHVRQTPVVDGSGLKNTVEREAVQWLARQGLVDFAHLRTLMVCGVDRFGMSAAIGEQGGPVVYGDLPFALGVPLPLHSAKAHRRLARVLLPLIVQLPLSFVYPTGEKQNKITPRWGRLYQEADVIAGDYLLIHRHLPPPDPRNPPLAGKIILTNTTTDADVKALRERGARLLITTTPCIDGRTFGTNVMEAVLVALNGGKVPSENEYPEMLTALNFQPTIRTL